MASQSHVYGLETLAHQGNNSEASLIPRIIFPVNTVRIMWVFWHQWRTALPNSMLIVCQASALIHFVRILIELALLLSPCHSICHYYLHRKR